jgi:hypothetical protein
VVGVVEDHDAGGRAERGGHRREQQRERHHQVNKPWPAWRRRRIERSRPSCAAQRRSREYYGAQSAQSHSILVTAAGTSIDSDSEKLGRRSDGGRRGWRGADGGVRRGGCLRAPEAEEGLVST